MFLVSFAAIFGLTISPFSDRAETRRHFFLVAGDSFFFQFPACTTAQLVRPFNELAAFDGTGCARVFTGSGSAAEVVR
jgi:hypothetical protein